MKDEVPSNLQKAFLQWLLTLLCMLHLASKANNKKRKQTEHLGGQIPSRTPVALPICYGSHKKISLRFVTNFCISESALSAFLDGLERRQIDLLRFTGDKGPDLRCTALKDETNLEPSKRWAHSRCQFFLQQTELLHPVRAESMGKQFASFQIHFLLASLFAKFRTKSQKRSPLRSVMKGTLAGMMSTY